MSQLVLELDSAVATRNATRASGRLMLNGKSYAVVSGGYGRGPLPAGMYRVKVRQVVDRGLGNGFRIGATQYFIPIESRFQSNRSGLGIHPDGGPLGTKGCIGLQGDDAKAFWTDWTRLPLGGRPTTLAVRWM